jgi:predicted N-acetyltransferase YhbS
VIVAMACGTSLDGESGREHNDARAASPAIKLPTRRRPRQGRRMTEAEPSLRLERTGDATEIAAVLTEAFGGADEAALVERLRAAGALTVSLVALEDGKIQGHAALSPVTIEGEPGSEHWLGLAPVAVRPGYQGRGLGRRLVEAALAQATARGTAAVFVLGHPGYYGSLGFTEAAGSGWRCSYPAPSAAFRVRLLAQDGLPPPGTVAYHPAFDGL